MNLNSTTILSSLTLAIVCPMANEQQSAVAFVGRMLEESAPFKNVVFFAILDTVSQDSTLDLLRTMAKEEPRLKVVWAPENRCVVDAYIRGYEEALSTSADWILEVDAGFSHQPEDLRKFFAPMLEGYRCIFGSRFCEGGRFTEGSLKRYLISRGGTLLSRWLLGTRLTDMTSGYQMFQRDALQAILKRGIISRGHFFQTEMKAYCRKMKVTEVPIHYRAPSSNVGSQTLKDAFSRLWALFRERVAGTL
jgi:dolichol-phosphate mannosyltransferase